MPKGEHFKKVTKKDKSFIIRFTTDEIDSLNQVCSLLNTTKTDFIRTTIFKAITTTLPKEQTKPLPAVKSEPVKAKVNQNAKEMIFDLYQRNISITDIVKHLKESNIVNKFGANYNYDTINKLLIRNKLK